MPSANGKMPPEKNFRREGTLRTRGFVFREPSVRCRDGGMFFRSISESVCRRIEGIRFFDNKIGKTEEKTNGKRFFPWSVPPGFAVPERPRSFRSATERRPQRAVCDEEKAVAIRNGRDGSLAGRLLPSAGRKLPIGEPGVCSGPSSLAAAGRTVSRRRYALFRYGDRQAGTLYNKDMPQGAALPMRPEGMPPLRVLLGRRAVRNGPSLR